MYQLTSMLASPGISGSSQRKCWPGPPTPVRIAPSLICLPCLLVPGLPMTGLLMTAVLRLLPRAAVFGCSLPGDRHRLGLALLGLVRLGLARLGLTLLTPRDLGPDQRQQVTPV